MDAAAALQRKIRNTIPLSEAMQFEIRQLSPDAISVGAPLPPNRNIHGTGFAGSIYSLAILSGWALCTHLLEHHQQDAELVVAKAQIRYRTPVSGDLTCATEVTEAARVDFMRGLEQQGKGLIELTIRVGSLPSAELVATYCALKR